jgi:hypothetical protein
VSAKRYKSYPQPNLDNRFLGSIMEIENRAFKKLGKVYN